MTKYADIRSRQPLVGQSFTDLGTRLDELAHAQDQHFVVVREILGPDVDGTHAVFEVDLVLLSVLNRSLDLLDGFMSTYPRWNLSSAASLVRLQVDNLLRLSLLAKAPASSDVTQMLLSGDRLSRVLDPLAEEGQQHRLTDARLRDHARDRFPWVDGVYEKASGWVHFSDVHVGVTIDVSDDGALAARFPSDIERYSYDFLEQVLWAMSTATTGILDIARWFAAGKAAATSSRRTDDVDDHVGDHQSSEEHP